jgi:hypothetical protein
MTLKRLLILMLVLGLASAANAELLISVNGVVDPPTLTLFVSNELTIDIHGFDNPANEPFMGWILIQGEGAIDASAPTYLWETSTVNNMPDPPLSDYIAALPDYGYPYVVDIIEFNIQDLVEPVGEPANGLLIDGLIYHMEGLGVVTLTMMDPDLAVLDTQIIMEVPEPATICLLVLGGLLLRRRKQT